MSSAELQSHLVPLMARKVPLPDILTRLSNVPAWDVMDMYDQLTCEAFDTDLVLQAAS